MEVVCELSCIYQYILNTIGLEAGGWNATGRHCLGSGMERELDHVSTRRAREHTNASRCRSRHGGSRKGWVRSALFKTFLGSYISGSPRDAVTFCTVRMVHASGGEGLSRKMSSS